MPFYLIEQRGIPGERLVEAEKPQTALNHIIEDSFTVRRVTDRELVDAAKRCEIEVAGAPKVDPEPESARVDNPVDPDDSKPIVEPDPDAARDLRDDPAFPPGEDEFGKLDD
jgi:hypothetical protein